MTREDQVDFIKQAVSDFYSAQAYSAGDAKRDGLTAKKYRYLMYNGFMVDYEIPDWWSSADYEFAMREFERIIQKDFDAL